MSGFKGTPGKWSLGMDGEILSDAGYIVMGTDLVHGNENDLELIAAARELLEVLQGALLAQILPEYHAEKARAAIARALGQ